MDVELLKASKAWPVAEAARLLERVGTSPPDKGYVLFETGYGPSGLPHIGTFAEVFRTSLVRQAFGRMSDLPTKLFAFSDDMDGLRAVPENIPNAAMVAQHLQRPLTSIPDPFGTAESYGHHMNQRLRAFLDGMGFEYTFVSATSATARAASTRCCCACSSGTRRCATSCCRALGRAARDLQPDPAGLPGDGPGAAGAAAGDRSRGRHDHLSQRGGPSGRAAGHRRPGEAAVARRLGDALGSTRRRLRDVRQGPDRFGQDLEPDLPHSRRRAARGLFVRAVPRRARPKDFQVEGQRPHGRASGWPTAPRKA